MKRKRGITALHEPDRPVRVVIDPLDPGRDRFVPADEVRSLYKQKALIYHLESDTYRAPIEGLCPDDIKNCPMASDLAARELVKASRLVRGTVVSKKRPRKLR